MYNRTNIIINLYFFGKHGKSKIKCSSGYICFKYNYIVKYSIYDTNTKYRYIIMSSYYFLYLVMCTISHICLY